MLSFIKRRSLRRFGVLAATAVTLAGTLQAVAPPGAALAAAPSDHVVFWNDVLLQAYRDAGGAPGPLARAGAMMHVAMYDAANSILCARREADCLGQPYVIKVAGGGDFDTALDYAAHDTLKALFGDKFGAKLTEAQSGTPASPQQAAGQSVGKQAAQAIVQNRTNDGSANQTPYTFQPTPGAFQRTVQGQEPATPNWGAVRPFTMTSGSQFRPPLPGGATTYQQLLTSSIYTEQFNEVKSLGERTSTIRTPDQTDAAFFWANDLDGTYKPPGQIFAHTQLVARDQHVPVESKVKLFAQVALAMADASILAWDRKYLGTIDLWRPETAIQAQNDGNPDTTQDPAWKPLSQDRNGVSFSPNFPAFVSGHATFAYTWAAVMRHWFGRDDIAYTGTTEDPHKISTERHFDSFTDAADENAHSRLWLGVHWHFDADSVLNPGTELGDWSVDHSLLYNTSDTELLYLHRDGVTDPEECDNTGRQISNEHRWEFWRCDIDGQSFDLYVH